MLVLLGPYVLRGLFVGLLMLAAWASTENKTGPEAVGEAERIAAFAGVSFSGADEARYKQGSSSFHGDHTAWARLRVDPAVAVGLVEKLDRVAIDGDHDSHAHRLLVRRFSPHDGAEKPDWWNPSQQAGLRGFAMGIEHWIGINPETGDVYVSYFQW